MKFLSELYDVTLKRGIRGKASEGFIRPTIGQSFMTHLDFEEIESQSKSIGFEQNLCEGGTPFSSDGDAYKAFNKSNTSYDIDSWAGTLSVDAYIGYDFGSPTRVNKIRIYATNRLDYYPLDYIIQGGDNQQGPWTDLLVADLQRHTEVYSFKDYYLPINTKFQCYRIYITDAQNSGIVEIGEIEMFPLYLTNDISAWTSDLCEGGVITSIDGVYQPEKSFDNDRANFSRFNTVPEGWIQYQFNEAKRIQKLTLDSHYTSGWDPIRGFKLFASNTGQFSGEEVLLLEDEYSDIYGTNDPHISAAEYYFNNDSYYEYYRIKLDGTIWYGNGSNNFHINEIEMMEAENFSYSLNDVKSNNLCTGGTPFSNVTPYDGRDASRAFDGTATSYSVDIWAATLSGDYIDVGYDFGEGNEKQVVRMDITCGRTGNLVRDYIIQGGPSTEGPWTDLHTVVDQQWITNYTKQRINFENTNSYRCYRLYITSGNATTLEIGEIEMYGI